MSGPKINEEYIQNELIDEYVLRLSELKAKYVANEFSEDNAMLTSLIIASDQALECNNKIFGKPGNYENAKKQLSFLSGKVASFYTGICVINKKMNSIIKDVVRFDVEFRSLSLVEIDNYISKEAPYDCAGSFKSEKLGISLLKRMNGDDPTALIGLPLIRLCKILRNEGVNIP